jgi:hypothetical protein
MEDSEEQAVAASSSSPVREPTLITYGQLWERVTQAPKSNRCKAEQAVAEELHGDSSLGYSSCKFTSLHRKIIDVTAAIKKKRRNKSKDLADYLLQTFHSPQERKIPGSTMERALKKENATLKRKLENSCTEKQDLELHLEASQEVVSQTLAQCAKLEDEMELVVKLKDQREEDVQKITKEFEEATKKLDRCLKQMPREKCRKQKLLYRDDQIKKLRLALKTSETENRGLWRTLLEEDGEDTETEWKKEMEDKMAALKKELAARSRKLKGKEEKLKCVDDQWKQKMKETREEVHHLKIEVDELRDAIQCAESDQVKTFENGRYTDAMRECVMLLITQGNVSLRKVPVVINAVMSSLAGKLPERIPSQALISHRIMTEAMFIAHKQVMLAFNHNNHQLHSVF